MALAGWLLFFNLIQGANPAGDTSAAGASEADFEGAASSVASEFWRCPLNVKLDLQRENILESLNQAREEKNKGDIIRLENALEAIDALREKYYLESYR